jgi:hypothetical protein
VNSRGLRRSSSLEPTEDGRAAKETLSMSRLRGKRPVSFCPQVSTLSATSPGQNGPWLSRLRRRHWGR